MERRKKRAKYGISNFKLLNYAIPLAGLSTNLGDPRGFTREMLNEFGAFIKSEINYTKNP